jgi:hypothetical protein
LNFWIREAKYWRLLDKIRAWTAARMAGVDRSDYSFEMEKMLLELDMREKGELA